MRRVRAAIVTGLIGAKLALFIGPTATTWDKDAYAQAELMKLNKVPAEEIRQKTGIWWGPDGKPRSEIDDSGAVVTGDTGTVGKALDHPELYKAYPDISGIQADVQKAGVFDESYRGNYRTGPLYPTFGDLLSVKADPEHMKQTILHELQHAIQAREGWKGNYVGPAGSSFIETQADPILFGRYQRAANEAEARAAAARGDMTAEQRRRTPPEKSYDVPIDELTGIPKPTQGKP